MRQNATAYIDPVGVSKVTITCNKIMSVVGKRYTLINVCEELSGDKVTIIVFHGYPEVVSPRAEAVAVASLVR